MLKRSKGASAPAAPPAALGADLAPKPGLVFRLRRLAPHFEAGVERVREDRSYGPLDRLSRDTEHAEPNELSERFEEVATLLASIDIETVWDAATTTEKRVLKKT